MFLCKLFLLLQKCLLFELLFGIFLFDLLEHLLFKVIIIVHLNAELDLLLFGCGFLFVWFLFTAGGLDVLDEH
jgi:hypothetical protein